LLEYLIAKCLWNDFTKLKPTALPATTRPWRKFGPAENAATGSGTYFPKSKASGRSSTARTYALRDLGEARDYLRDPILRARYDEIVAAVSEQLARGINVEDLMGGRTDALKLVSSLTLFRAAAEQLGREDPVYASLAGRLAASLELTSAQGYPACDFTLARIDTVGVT
jgi:hypothetical protein